MRRFLPGTMRATTLQWALLALLAGLTLPGHAAERVVLAGAVSPRIAGAVDAGAVPVSQKITSITLQLKTTPEQQAALAQFLSDVIDASSTSYHQWLTPVQFAEKFGAPHANIDALSQWLAAQGLSVDLIARSHTSITVSGTAAQVQQAFGVALHQYQMGDYAATGRLHFANTSAPSLPAEIAGLVSGVQGLNDFSAPASAAAAPDAAAFAAKYDAAAVFAQSIDGRGVNVAAANQSWANVGAPRANVIALSAENSLAELTAAVDANVQAVLSVNAVGCETDFSDDEVAAYRAIFVQANAQGITVIANAAGCANGAAFPASLPEVTAVGVSNGVPSTLFARPDWQSVSASTMRSIPDLAFDAQTDPSAFAGVIALVVQKGGVRQGNVNQTLYRLAVEPGIFSQTDTGTSSATSGLYSPTTGLGAPDVNGMLSAWPLGSVATVTSITSTNFAPTHGQSITLTATVSPSAATGNITFMDGTSTLTTVVLSSGSATYTTNQLAGGSHSITAVYGGDNTYSGSTSGTASITVLAENATVSATLSSGAVIGSTVTASVTVTSTSGVGTPTGTVTATANGMNGNPSGMATLSGSGASVTAAPTFTATQAGTYTVQVSCSSTSASFSCSTPANVSLTVGKGTTTTALSISPNPPTAGSPVTLTATVAPTSTASGLTAVGGTVQFMDGTTALGSGTVSSGVATYSTTLTEAKTHSLTAVYGGDTNYTTSTSSAVSAAGGQASTTVNLGANSFAINYGATLTLTATVVPSTSAATGVTPTGMVTFSGATQGVIGSATLSSGVATFTSTTLVPGTYTLTANYAGDTNFSASSSTVNTVVTISPAAATITATISPSSAQYGTNATISATVTPSTGTATPTGTVTASISGVSGSATGTLSGSAGVATASIAFPVPAPSGPYTVNVACTSTNYTCGTAATVMLSTTKGNSITTLSVAPNPVVINTPITLTAAITNAGGGTGTYSFTGTVTFYDNGVVLGSAVTVSGNQAIYTTTYTTAKTHSFLAIYSGDTNWIGSTSSSLSVTVQTLPTSSTLTSSVTAALAGTAVQLTAIVSATGNTASKGPTGLVTFYDTYNGGTQMLGTASLGADGPYASIAVLSTTGLQAGTHNIYGIYAGDTNYATSTTAVLVITMADYTLVAVPQSLTITPGQSGQVAIIVGLEGGFTGTVTFGCTPPTNSEMTCSISPITLTGGGTTTMTILSTAPSAKSGGTQARNGTGNGMWRPGGTAVLAALLCMVPGKRRRVRSLLLMMLLAVAVAGTGCTVNYLTSAGSGSGGGTGSDSGTPLGTQNFTINSAGTDDGSTVSHSQSYTVTVQ